MASKKFPTRHIVPEEETLMDAENTYKNVEETRRLVEDTTKYPYKAIAYLETQYFSDANELGGTGFLCENNLFITVAHNVWDADEGRPAKNVTITFGLDGEEDYSKRKQIVLEGCDFTVPKKYKKKTDECDIAWVDLQQCYRRKVESEEPISWELTDLPDQSFYTCSIPESHGELDKGISICGKYLHLGSY